MEYKCILDNEEQIEAYFKNEPNNKIALIDADTIAYNACLACEYEQYNTETGEDEFHQDLQAAFEHAQGKIELIMEQTGCASLDLNFSASSKNTFRVMQVTDTYKANRDGMRYPTGLRELKSNVM